MRKASRKLSEVEALEIFDRAPYVTVSMTRVDGSPYGVPLSLVRANETTFYFHCAPEGEKIDCMKANPIVSLSAVSRCKPVYEEEKNNFTEYYRSAIALGRISFVEEKEEKIHALRLLCERFLPNHMEHFQTAVERSLERTTIVKVMLIEEAVGKHKGF